MIKVLTQFVSGFADGDAISREARILRDAAVDLGMESEIYAPAETTAAKMRNACRPVAEYLPADDEVVVYHCSTKSSATEAFLNTSSRKILRYHNITPSRFFRGYDDKLASELDRAREGLDAAVDAADEVWAVSSFNASELSGAAASVKSVPLLFSADDFISAESAGFQNVLAGPQKNILCVGRLAPNKCLEELIEAFAYLNRCIDPLTRLVITGSERSCPAYFSMLKLLALRLGLNDIVFTCFLSDEQLGDAYRSASLMVSVSRHEGYCLPLLEAMSHNVPVLARNSGGMPEAMGGAGVLYDGLDSQELAELMSLMLSDNALRDSVLDAQAKRLEDVRSRDIKAELASLLGM